MAAGSEGTSKAAVATVKAGNAHPFVVAHSDTIGVVPSKVDRMADKR